MEINNDEWRLKMKAAVVSSDGKKGINAIEDPYFIDEALKTISANE